jgi:hypothetical protein
VTHPYRRRFGLTADCQAPVQNRRVCFESLDCCLIISAEAMLRARPAAAFALLNHMLISGFFFSQGFFILLSPSSAVLTAPARRASDPGVRKSAHSDLPFGPGDGEG